MPLATRAGHVRVRTGPRDPELRRARSCYDHLAGDLAVKMLDRFIERRLLARRGDELRVTRDGERFFAKAGIDIDKLDSDRRPLCRPCLDWSERRSHLGGTLGAAIFEYILRTPLGGPRSQDADRALLGGGRAEADRVVFQIVRYFRSRYFT